VEKTGRALIVCEDCKTGGVSAEIMARVVEECFDFLQAKAAPRCRSRCTRALR
jgi:pyruvate/2-oxoglutarate/acetoin dehydrogenase E1 component